MPAAYSHLFSVRLYCFEDSVAPTELSSSGPVSDPPILWKVLSTYLSTIIVFKDRVHNSCPYINSNWYSYFKNILRSGQQALFNKLVMVCEKSGMYTKGIVS